MLENLPWEPLVNIIVTLHDFGAKGDRTLITHLHLTTKEIGFIILLLPARMREYQREIGLRRDVSIKL